MEYSKFLDWADSAGLTVESPDKAQSILKEKLRIDPAILTAIVPEMSMSLQTLTAIGERCKGKRIRESQAQPASQSTIPSILTPETATAIPRLPSHPRKMVVSDLDVQAYSAIFSSSEVPPEKRKYTKGSITS